MCIVFAATSEERSCNKRQNDGLAECSASDQFSFIQGCAGSSISDYTIGMHLRSVECDVGTLVCSCWAHPVKIFLFKNREIRQTASLVFSPLV